MLDLENLIDEIELVENRLREHREERKELLAVVAQKDAEYYALRDYYQYLLAKKKTN